MMMMVASLASLTVENKTFYDRNTLDVGLDLLAFINACTKKRLKANEGTSIQFRRFESLGLTGTTPLTEGVTPSEDTLAITPISATVRQYGNYILHTDLIKNAGIDNVVLEKTTRLSQNRARVLDTLAKNVAVTGTSVRYGTGAARNLQSSANPLTLNLVKKAVTELRANNAEPFYGKRGDEGQARGYMGIIHPNVFFDLTNDTAVQTTFQYSDKSGIYKFQVAELGGVMWIESALAPVFAGAGASGADVYGTVIFGRDAMACVDPSWNPIKGGYQNGGAIIKEVGSAGAADPLNQRGSVGWKSAFAAAILDNTFMTRIETGTAYA